MAAVSVYNMDDVILSIVGDKANIFNETDTHRRQMDKRSTAEIERL